MNRLATEYKDRVDIRRLNVDDPANDAAMTKYRFEGQPQVVIVDRQGNIVFSTHFSTYESLKQELEAVLRTS